MMEDKKKDKSLEENWTLLWKPDILIPPRVKDDPKDLEDIENFLEEGKAPKDLPTNKNKVLDLKFAPFKS